jgi:hypothetical protein
MSDTRDTKEPVRVRRPLLTTSTAASVPSDEGDQSMRAERTTNLEDAARALPVGGTIESVVRDGAAAPMAIVPGFEPRDGDTLVISYPEVTLPLPKQYSMMKFGGAIYTRKLQAGDDLALIAGQITKWLARTIEADAGAKYRRLAGEFVKGSR